MHFLPKTNLAETTKKSSFLAPKTKTKLKFGRSLSDYSLVSGLRDISFICLQLIFIQLSHSGHSINTLTVRCMSDVVSFVDQMQVHMVYSDILVMTNQ